VPYVAPANQFPISFIHFISMTSKACVLFVLSQPGTKVTSEEFHDWYDNEHVPDRLRLYVKVTFRRTKRTHIISFRSGFKSSIRYEATDGKNPHWAASYDLDDADFLKTPEYLHLMNNRSPREKSVISRLDALDRRIYNLVYSQGQFLAQPNDDFTLVTVELKCSKSSAAEVEDWYRKVHLSRLILYLLMFILFRNMLICYRGFRAG